MTTEHTEAETPVSLPSWNLPYSGPTDPQIAEDLEADLSDAKAFRKRYEGRITTFTAPQLLAALKEREALTARARSPKLYAVLMIYNYPSMEGVGALRKQAIDTSNAINEELQFWNKELQQLDGDRLEAMCRDNTELAKYRPYFSHLRTFTDHTPSPEALSALNRHGSTSSEKDLNFSSQHAPGYARQQQLIRDTMQNNLARMRFRFGDEVLPLSPVTDKRASMSVAERRQAYEVLRDTLNDYAEGRLLTPRPGQDGTPGYVESTTPTPAMLMNKLIAAKNAEDAERNYAHPDSAAILNNDMEPDIVEALRKAVKEHYPLAQRYFKAKASLLEKDRLDPWDPLAPLPSSQADIPWEDAKKMVLDAFKAFSPDIRKIAERAFDEGWIDAEPRAGKYHGAYCTDPGDGLRIADHPYISLNYHGKPKDVTTLAHELGHAVHFYLVSQKQGSDLLTHFSLALAETASLFAETLVFKQLMEKAETDEQKLALLDQKIMSAVQTVMMQITYDDFEQQVHERVKNGETLTPEDYGQIWKACSKKRLGDTVADDPKDKGNGWLLVSHLFDSPFYVHSYALANLLVFSLYQQYGQGDKTEFMQKYTQLLEAGGTEHHDVALKQRFGDQFDLTNPQFWEGGLNVIKDMVDHYEALASKVRDRTSKPSTVIPMGDARANGGTTEPNPNSTKTATR